MNTRQLAEQYIRDQIKIMEQHGDKPNLSEEKMKEAVSNAERTFETMKKCSTDPISDAE